MAVSSLLAIAILDSVKVRFRWEQTFGHGRSEILHQTVRYASDSSRWARMGSEGR